eukprot:SAG31_NODE_32422_length_356_cov_0.774319_1_plen_64_part_10
MSITGKPQPLITSMTNGVVVRSTEPDSWGWTFAGVSTLASVSVDSAAGKWDVSLSAYVFFRALS